MIITVNKCNLILLNCLYDFQSDEKDFCRSYVCCQTHFPVDFCHTTVIYSMQCSAVGLGYVYYRMIYLLRYLMIFWIRRQKNMRINLHFSHRAAAVHGFT